MTLATPPSTTPTAKSSRPREERRVDGVGLGVLLFAVLGFVAVLALFRPAPAVTTAAVLPTAVLVDTHRPMDKHDDVVQGASQVDLHHPVDRHDEP